MKWTAGNRDNVEDVRGQSGGAGMRMGGLGLGGLLVVLVLSWATGVDFLSLVGPDAISTGPSASTGTGGELRTTPEEEKLVDFVDAVMKDAQEMWQTKLAGRYQATRAVIFRDAIQSACGFGAVGDGTVLLPGRLSSSTSTWGSSASCATVSARLATSRRPTCSRTSSAIMCSSCSESRRRSASSSSRGPISRTRCRSGSSCRRIALPASGDTRPRSPAAPRRARWSSSPAISRKG